MQNANKIERYKKCNMQMPKLVLEVLELLREVLELVLEILELPLEVLELVLVLELDIQERVLEVE